MYLLIRSCVHIYTYIHQVSLSGRVRFLIGGPSKLYADRFSFSFSFFWGFFLIEMFDNFDLPT